MHSLKKSLKPEIVNRYDLWVLRHKIGGAKVFVNNVQWSDQEFNSSFYLLSNFEIKIIMF
jgi:hypothetical protein